MASPRTGLTPCPAAAETRLGALESRDLARSALAAAMAGGKSLLDEAEALLQLGRIFTPSIEPHATFEAVTRAEQIFVAHGAPVQAARCGVAAARALLDLGQERDAVERARRALGELSLPVAHRVAGIVVVAKSQAQFGRLDAASQLLTHTAAPLAEAGSPVCRIHVKKALALVRFQMLLAAEFPHLHRGLGVVGGEGGERPAHARLLALLDEIEDELAPGERWLQVEAIRQLTRGLCEPGDPAPERLAALAVDALDVDPPVAAWAWYAQSLLHRQRGELAPAQASVDRCLAVSQQWGLKAIARHAFFQQSLIRESIEDYAGSLQAYKTFSAMRLRSVTMNVDLQDPIAAPAALALPRPLESRHVKRALRFIESNLGVPISVSDIAAECQVSRRTLEVAFKQSKACTLAQYVKRRRLETAAGLLRFSGLRVSEVARSVGYQWPSAFARDFVAHCGVRPTEWRARHADEAVGQGGDPASLPTAALADAA